MGFVSRFIQAFVGDLDPVAAATWARGLVYGIAGASANGIIDVLTQLSGQMNGPGAIVISWKLVGRTIAIAVIPAIILYLQKPHGSSKEDVDRMIRTAIALPEDTTVAEVKAIATEIKGNK